MRAISRREFIKGLVGLSIANTANASSLTTYKIPMENIQAFKRARIKYSPSKVEIEFRKIRSDKFNIMLLDAVGDKVNNIPKFGNPSDYLNVKIYVPIQNGKVADNATLMVNVVGNFYLSSIIWLSTGMIAIGLLNYIANSNPTLFYYKNKIDMAASRFDNAFKEMLKDLF